jgi:hypothetical protein
VLDKCFASGKLVENSWKREFSTFFVEILLLPWWSFLNFYGVLWNV